MKSNFNLGDLNIEDTIQAGTIVLITEGAHDDYKITGVFRADVDVVVPFRPSKWLKDSKTIDTDKLSTMLTEVPYAEAYGDD